MSQQEPGRRLTAAEQRRSAVFEQLRSRLTDSGYREVDLTVSVGYANVMAPVLSLPVILCLAVPFLLRRRDLFTDPGRLFDLSGYLLWLALFFGAILLLSVLHELIHGITWSFFTEKGRRAISFGFIAKYLTPYCTCDEPLKKGAYIAGSLMPTVVLGILPAAAAIVTGSVFLFALGAMMILAGGGDFTVTLKLLRFPSRGAQVLCIDHPYQVGLVVFVK